MVAQVAQIIDVQSLAGQEVLNVFHYVDTSGAASLATLVSDFEVDYMTSVANMQTNQLAHIATRYRIVSPTAGLQQTHTLSSPHVGQQSDNDPLASCDAYSVAWTLGATVVLAGGFTGHLKRGGARIAGPTEGLVSGNVCVGAALATWPTAFGNLQAPGSGGWQLVVASYLNGARVRQTTVQAYCLVTGTSVPSPSTQNTRKVLRGRTF